MIDTPALRTQPHGTAPSVNGLAALLAAGVLVAAAFGLVHRVAGPLPLWSTAGDRMRLQCALPFVAVAAALYLMAALEHRRWARVASRALGIGVATWGVLLFLPVAQARLHAQVGAPGTAHVGFLLVGTALATIGSRRSALFRVAEGTALVCGITSFVAILAHIYHFSPLGPATGWQLPSFETEMAFLLAAVGTLSLDRSRGIAALLRGDGLGSRVARPLIVASVLLPTLLDLLATTGIRSGVYDRAIAGAVHAILVSAASTAIVLMAALWLEQMDAERREAIGALRETEERLELQIGRMPIGCIVWSPSFRVMSWNAAAQGIFGFSEEEMLGRDPFGTIVAEDVRPAVEHVWSRLMERDEAAHSVNENRTKDGRTIVCSWSNTPLARADGTVIGVVSMVQDVTEKTRIERELKENEERYRDLVEHSHDLICTHDLDGNILSVNPAVERVTGLPAAAMLGRNIRELLVPAARPEFETYLSTILANGQAAGVMTVFDARGEVRHWAYQNTVRYENGSPSMVRGMARDVTEQRRAESLLRKSESRYRTLFEDGPQASVVFDGTTQCIVAANHAALQLFGRTRDEALGLRITDADLSDDVSTIAAAQQEPAPVRRRSNLRFRRKDRSVFLGDVASSAFEFEGRPARLVVITDVTEREQAKRELLEARSFNEEVISNAGQGILVRDGQGRILVWNRFMERLTGVTAGEIIGTFGERAFPSWHGSPMEDAFRATQETGSPQTTEVRVELKGEGRWLWNVDVPHLNQEGKVAGAIAIVSDITAQKQTEEALRESEELYRAILDTSPNIVFSLDLEGRFRSANRTLCSLLGTTEEELIGRGVVEVGFLPGARTEWEDHHLNVLRTGLPWSYRTSGTAPDGQVHVYDVFLCPLNDAGGAVTGISSIAIDVTSQLEAAESLTRLSHAVEQADEVIFMTDRDGVITYANPAFESTYGYSRAEALGKTPRLLKSGMHTPGEYVEFWQRILQGETVRGEVTNRKKDGTLVDVQRSVSPVFNDGELIGFLSVQTDVSERRRMEQEQQRLQARMNQVGKMEAIGTLAGGIAHDFNNILSIILSFSTLAERSRDDSVRFASAFGTIREAVQRGADLAKQILTFARRGESCPEPVDVNRIVGEVVRMAHGTFSRNILLQTSLGAGVPLVVADPSQLHQALLNLCVNARDAMSGPGGTISVRTSTVSGDEVRPRFPEAADASYVRIEVTDSGIGMSAEVQQRIFEPFFTTKAEGRGTGLGLAVTYGVVRAAGGFIGVRSEIGRGSTFDVLLPVPAAAVESDQGLAAPATRAEGTETVLLVEDEPALLPFLAESLREHGYSVLTSADGAEALRLYEQHRDRIRVVVSDDGLPGLAGRNLFQSLRRSDGALPFILASGFVEGDVLAELEKAGLSRFLQKPYDVAELVAAIRQALDTPAHASA